MCRLRPQHGCCPPWREPSLLAQAAESQALWAARRSMGNRVGAGSSAADTLFGCHPRSRQGGGLPMPLKVNGECFSILGAGLISTLSHGGCRSASRKIEAGVRRTLSGRGFHSARRGRSSQAPDWLSGLSDGNSTSKVLPWPTWLSTVTRPPSSSTMDRMM